MRIMYAMCVNGIEITIKNKFTTTVKGKKVANTEKVGSVKLDVTSFDFEELDNVITSVLAFYPDGASADVSFSATNTY